MQVSRLDKIIENNVTYSTQKSNQDQMIYILQDISSTLAMIYDHLCGSEPVSEATESVVTMAYVIPFEELNKYKTMHIEMIDFSEGYEVNFVNMYENYDYANMENNVSVLVKAFDGDMRLDGKWYNKKWRCWNIKPTEEERKKVKWKS